MWGGGNPVTLFTYSIATLTIALYMYNFTLQYHTIVLVTHTSIKLGVKFRERGFLNQYYTKVVATGTMQPFYFHGQQTECCLSPTSTKTLSLTSLPCSNPKGLLATWGPTEERITHHHALESWQGGPQGWSSFPISDVFMVLHLLLNRILDDRRISTSQVSEGKNHGILCPTFNMVNHERLGN